MTLLLNFLYQSVPVTQTTSVHLRTIPVLMTLCIAESPTAQSTQPLGSLQSVNLESMLRYTFVPDYTVRAVADTYYMRVKRSFYLAAKRATLMERSKITGGDNFEDEVEKVSSNNNTRIYKVTTFTVVFRGGYAQQGQILALWTTFVR